MTSAFSGDASSRRTSSSRFAKISPLRHFVSEFDLQDKYAVIPENFQIGNQFRAGLKEDSALLGDGNMPPFELTGNPAAALVRVSPKVRRYGRHYVARLTHVVSFDVPILDELLPAFTAALGHLVTPERSRLLKRIIALAAGVELSSLDGAGKVRTHINLRVGATDGRDLEAEISEWLSANRRQIVAAHISRQHTRVPDPRLERALLDENAELNLKSESQILLLNAQGSTLIAPALQRAARAPSGAVDARYHNRHGRVTDLSEIASVMQHIILRARRMEDLDSVDWANDPKVVQRWISYPRNVFHASVSNERVWQALSQAYALPSLLREVTEMSTPESGVDGHADSSFN